MEFVNKRLGNLNRYVDMPFGTESETDLWKARVLYQIDFFNKLKQQLEYGDKLNI